MGYMVGMEFDEEILNDFLVEAGEILERLSEELVQIERKPSDSELLNSIFRGFHTIKGGAGFLQLTPLVDICHITENLFDRLRNLECQLSSGMMDAVLHVVDVLHIQFQQLQQGEMPEPAPQAVIDELSQWLNQATAVDQINIETSNQPSISNQTHSTNPQDLTNSSNEENLLVSADDEFADLLAALDGASDSAKSVAENLTESTSESLQGNTVAQNTDRDDITSDEFEALLDQLHGVGQAPGSSIKKSIEEEGADSGKDVDSGGFCDGVDQNSSPVEQAAGASIDDMSEAEFEALLDQLHGIGKAPQGEQSKQKNASLEQQNEQSKECVAKCDSQTEATFAEKTQPSQPSDDISDDEFEALLDQLHGSGKRPSGVSSPATPLSENGSTAIGGSLNNQSKKPVKVESVAFGQSQKTPAQLTPKTDANETEKTGLSVKTETSVRVDTQRLDDIMNLVGELVLVRNRLVRLGGDQQDAEIGKTVSSLDVVTADLQAAVMKTRMQPIKKVFGRFPRVVRDLARQLNKEVNLEMRGEETDLDKNLVEALADPLIHLVRNSIDHGIELPEEREAAGKPRLGKVELAAQQEGDHILLTIRDDGRGMDVEKIKSLAIQKGVLEPDAAERLSEKDALSLIFAPGFSTKEKITNISGRGVGMDVVKTKISQLNGSIEIDSQPSQGTLLAIKVPLTLAIMPTLMVRLAEQTFALPLVNVDEIFDMDLSKRHRIDGQDCITIRERAIPLFFLRHWLIDQADANDIPKQGHVVVVSIGTNRVGFVVDQLVGQEEVVIKPLGTMLQGTPGMAGATITGDGRIALILDVPGLLSHYSRTFS